MPEPVGAIPLDGICGYCDERVSARDAIEHFAERHPGMEWSLLTWPDGSPALIGEEDR